jgi:hemoglobin
VQTIYDAIGGDETVLGLAGAWHARVMADEVVSHAFSQGFHPEHTERLAAYWAEALGGPTTYSERYGNESMVVRMHSGNGPHEEMDRRAIACFDGALVDLGLADDDRLRRVLLRVDHHDHDVPLPRIQKRRAGRAGYSPLVVGRTRPGNGS